jgi:hypothetical protein
MVRTHLKGRIELGVEGLDVLASLALRTRTFSPGLVTPLACIYHTVKKPHPYVSGTQ